MSTGSNPFEMMERMIDQMRTQFDQAARAWESEGGELPSLGGGRLGIDLADHGEEYVVTADVPGFDEDEIDLRITGRTLELQAHRDTASEQEDATYLRSERTHRSLQKHVQFPEPVEADEITATLTNGVLTVRVPKAEPKSSEGHEIDIE